MVTDRSSFVRPVDAVFADGFGSSHTTGFIADGHFAELVVNVDVVAGDSVSDPPVVALDPVEARIADARLLPDIAFERTIRTDGTVDTLCVLRE
ncbi:hypothetical protein C5C07_15480 [Haloferax sp. Atlit-4N]|uniref:hypothetical protein n=1 Tax=Haloferax sp. Atlit-4N TaxID=2077206 RepID=UPI000E286BA5|nr:hypothetical protein [Haloferax sp. Atlit-4N]RDZ53135.1 hypothetical protein C5C07_15480 [Haloferax sp. Atlit-4N]